MSRESRDQPPPGFTEFVIARRPSLVRIAYLLTGGDAEAEDLVQTALVKVVPHWRRIADHPDPYVRQVLVRESVARWRRRRWRELPSADLPDSADAGPGLSEDVERRLTLQAALAGLAPRQRVVIVLRYYEQLTEAETAAALGIAIGTVKSQTRDALARLRGLVTETEPVPAVVRPVGSG